MNTASRRFLIWSNEHEAWWGSGRHGYVYIIRLAGRYERDEAEAICRNANAYLPKDAEPNEVMVLAPEYLEAR